jgi:membrane-associated phospholipid phosphatase
MDSTLDWGLQVVLWSQQFSPLLDGPFKFFTFLGEETFFLLLLPALYWCLDRHTGARLTVLFLLSTYLNFVAKMLADQPRPYDYDPRVHQLATAPGGGLPSGHAQNAVAVWSYLALQFQRAWLWWLAGVLIILISLSRLYLGVHFPTDLLGGYLLGALLLALYLRLEPTLEAWLAEQRLLRQLAWAVAVPMLLILLLPIEEGVTTGAVLLSMSVGFALERRWLGFEAGGSWQPRIFRFALGIVVLVGLWAGLRLAFAGWEPAYLFRFVRYSLMGLWGAFGAPWLFVKLGWAETRPIPSEHFSDSVI